MRPKVTTGADDTEDAEVGGKVVVGLLDQLEGEVELGLRDALAEKEVDPIGHEDAASMRGKARRSGSGDDGLLWMARRRYAEGTPEQAWENPTMTVSGQDLLDQHVAEELKEHGFVRPPWQYMDEHPYSLFWRMGGGEWHLMMFWSWWGRLVLDEASRIAWVRQWKPTPCWYPWSARLIWPELLDDVDDDTVVVEKLASLGMGSVQEWQDAEQKVLEELEASNEDSSPEK